MCYPYDCSTLSMYYTLNQMLKVTYKCNTFGILSIQMFQQEL